MGVKVSVVVPAYNAAADLPKCLGSLASQSFGDFEVLICDDGSADGTGDIAKKWAAKDPRFRYFYQENSGPSAARNLGLSKARGELIGFVDADDWVDPEFLEKMVTAMNISNVQLAWCGFQELSIHHPQGVSILPFYSEEPISAETYRPLIFEGLGGVLWNKLYRADILTEHNIRFDGKISFSEDMVFNFSYSRFVCNVAVIPESLVFYNRLNESSLTRTLKMTQLADLEESNRQILQIAAEMNMDCRNITERRTSLFTLSLAQTLVQQNSLITGLVALNNLKQLQPIIKFRAESGGVNLVKMLYNGNQTTLFAAAVKTLDYVRKFKK